MRSLAARLALAFSLLVLPLGALFVWGALDAARRYHQEIAQHQYQGLAENLLHLKPGLMVAGEQAGALDALAAELAMTNPGVEVYLLDERGRIVGASPPMEALVRKSVNAEPLERFVRGDLRGPLLGDDPKRPRGRQVFSAAPVPGGGWVYVLLSDRALDSVAAAVAGSTVLRLALWAGLGLVLLAALLAGGTAFWLTRRLTALEAAMERFDPASEGALAAPQRVRDEVDRLHGRFAELAGRVRDLIAAERAADRHRRELVAGVSHDLRTPLAVLSGYLETLEHAGDGLSAEERTRYLAAARAQAERLARMTEDLFTLARLESGAWPFEPEPLALAELVQDVALEWKPRFEAAGVKLEPAPPPGPLPVQGDAGLLERALVNLLANALAHTPAGGRVRITLEAANGEARVSVEDQGPGIDAADLARVFDRGFSKQGGGAGLGLAIAQQAARLHGGRVEVESERGRGSRFVLVLPEAS
ncbi:MAG TPA: HAMP domain-containing histidine kinase [Oceanithermus profundus]|uniref:histidine kinase n=1 Tax=Oceanithermus profundus TaxID=187137 RepID=A0A7C4V8C7_9DEIN|nr:HAMP domain-containing histidine kinase [Oceanithermus profundus]